MTEKDCAIVKSLLIFINPGGGTFMFEKALKLLTLSAFILFPISTIAQEDSVSSEIEEITVTGSQIKGAKITGALPVSVLDFQDVEALGVDSGDELLENVVENGMNKECGLIVNSSRSIIYAGSTLDFAIKSREAASSLQQQMASYLY